VRLGPSPYAPKASMSSRWVRPHATARRPQAGQEFHRGPPHEGGPTRSTSRNRRNASAGTSQFGPGTGCSGGAAAKASAWCRDDSATAATGSSPSWSSASMFRACSRPTPASRSAVKRFPTTTCSTRSRTEICDGVGRSHESTGSWRTTRSNSAEAARISSTFRTVAVVDWLRIGASWRMSFSGTTSGTGRPTARWRTGGSVSGSLTGH